MSRRFRHRAICKALALVLGARELLCCAMALAVEPAIYNAVVGSVKRTQHCCRFGGAKLGCKRAQNPRAPGRDSPSDQCSVCSTRFATPPKRSLPDLRASPEFQFAQVSLLQVVLAQNVAPRARFQQPGIWALLTSLLDLFCQFTN